MQPPPYLIALYIGLAALMFQLHFGLKKELNEDDNLQQSLLGIIDRERTGAFRAFAATPDLLDQVTQALRTPNSDPLWETVVEECEASLYDVAVKAYVPLTRCAEIRATRTAHVRWLRRGKGATMWAFTSGVVVAIAFGIDIWAHRDWMTWALLGLSAILVALIVWSLSCWYMADRSQSALAEVRRLRGRHL